MKTFISLRLSIIYLYRSLKKGLKAYFMKYDILVKWYIDRIIVALPF